MGDESDSQDDIEQDEDFREAGSSATEMESENEWHGFSDDDGADVHVNEDEGVAAEHDGGEGEGERTTSSESDADATPKPHTSGTFADVWTIARTVTRLQVSSIFLPISGSKQKQTL